MSLDDAERTFTYIWRYAFQRNPENTGKDQKTSSGPTGQSDSYLKTNSSRLESLIRVLLEERGYEKQTKLLNCVPDSLSRTLVNDLEERNWN
jgi:hypothetical protein